MNELMIFENPEFGKIRTVMLNGEPWIVGKDVADALGYIDTKHAIIDHVDEEDRVNSKTQGQNDPEFGQRGTWLINESGLYGLVLGSKLPGAKRLKHWVMSEVLQKMHKKSENIVIVAQKSEKANNYSVFESSEFGRISVLDVGDKPYFPATACAQILGYKRPADAITAHCKGSVKYRVPTSSGEQYMKFISEGDLYRLIVHSNLPTAERFERWIFDEVLPSIRKTGGYNLPKDYPSALRALADAEEKRLALEAQIETNRPMVEFAEAVHGLKKDIQVGDYSKILYDEHNIRMGRTKMFRWLRDNKYLMKNNIPYQKYIDEGWFKTRETIAGNLPYTQTLITGKGQQMLFQRLKAEFDS